MDGEPILKIFSALKERACSDAFGGPSVDWLLADLNHLKQALETIPHILLAEDGNNNSILYLQQDEEMERKLDMATLDAYKAKKSLGTYNSVLRANGNVQIAKASNDITHRNSVSSSNVCGSSSLPKSSDNGPSDSSNRRPSGASPITSDVTARADAEGWTTQGRKQNYKSVNEKGGKGKNGKDRRDSYNGIFQK